MKIQSHPLHYLTMFIGALLLSTSFFHFSCFAKPKSTPPADDLIFGKVTTTVDGDTFEMQINESKPIRVRIQGIDCPEFGQPYFEESKIRTTALLANQGVYVQVVKADRFGRIVGFVKTTTEQDIGAQLVKEGLCWWYEYFSPNHSELKALQDHAKHSRIGLWQDKDPMPPWQYRKKRNWEKRQRDSRRGTNMQFAN